jgi:hypothetical protein
MTDTVYGEAIGQDDQPLTYDQQTNIMYQTGMLRSDVKEVYPTYAAFLADKEHPNDG